MNRQVIYTRRYIPRPIRYIFWFLLIGIVIESVIHTTVMLHSVMARRHDVHTHRSAQ
jgi:hypothetical protein